MIEVLSNPIVQIVGMAIIAVILRYNWKLIAQLKQANDILVQPTRKKARMKINFSSIIDAMARPPKWQPEVGTTAETLIAMARAERQQRQQQVVETPPAASINARSDVSVKREVVNEAIRPVRAQPVPTPVRQEGGQSAAWLAAKPKTAPRIRLSQIARADNLAVVGQKGSGKTTLLLTLMANRSGAHVVVDPHNFPGKWPNAEVIGGGRKYDAIRNALTNLDGAMNERFGQLDCGEVAEGQFPRRTLVTDEFRSIATNIPKSKSERGAGDYLLDRIAEGRKVGECALLAAHNDTTAALGIEGNADMKTCFDYLIYTGGMAVQRFRARQNVTPEMVEELQADERQFVVWQTDNDQWFVLDYDLQPVVSEALVSSVSQVVPAGSQEPVPVEEAKMGGSGLGNQYGTSTEPVPGTDGIDAEVIKTLHSAGWSNNRIAAKMKGRREDRLARIREALGETVDLAA